MKKVSAFFNRMLAAGAVATMLASCNSSRMSLVQTVPVAQAPEAGTPVAVDAAEVPAAAQGAPAAEAYASTANATTTVAPVSTLEKARQESKPVTTAVPAKEVKKASLTERLAAKVLVKKIEKARRKFDFKKENAAKVDQQIRTGIIIAAVGLGLIVLAALTGSGVLYSLGVIGIIVGGVIILLAALDVI